jgi:hypothetical protein
VKFRHLRKTRIFLLTLAISSNLFSLSANAAETVAEQTATSSTRITFAEQPLDFPSFFRPNNENCGKKVCDWRDSKFGDGFIDYPRCDEVNGKNCLKSIEISTKQSEFSKLTFYDEIMWKKINIESPSLQMKGGAPSIWTMRGEDGNLKYFLAKIFSGFAWNNGDPILDKIEMRITPVTPVTQGGFVAYCLSKSNEACFRVIDFESDLRLRVSLSTPTSLGGFFMGRIGNPNVKQTLNSKTRQNAIELTAEPITVPRMSVLVPDDAAIPANLKFVTRGESQDFPSYDGWWNEIFNFASKFANDRVTDYSTVWSVYAMSPGSTSYAGCARPSSGFIGTGTTNAMRYDFNPPKFKDGFFTFKLSGLHYMPDGTNLELGQYELMLNSEFAMCLYRSSKVPLVARIEITNANGKTNVTTTASQERDGWFKLQIAALTFSTKTIKISFTSEKPKTIQCKKENKVQSITRVKPTCPKGWMLVKSA